MIKKFRKNYAILFCIFAILVCWVVAFKFIGFVSRETIGTLDISDRMLEGIGTIFCDGFVAVVAILILLITDRLIILKKRGVGFIKGLAVGALPLSLYTVGIIVFILAFAFTDPETIREQTDMDINPIFDMASVIIIISYFFVGFAEEFTLRGIVSQTLLEHFGTSNKGIWIAAIVSGAMFGLIHVNNLFVADPMFVFGQVFSAAGGGILYAAIYFRTGNIWIVVLAHALNDILASSVTWLTDIDLTSALSAVSGPSVVPYIMLAVDIAISLFLLRNKKIGEVDQSWPEFSEWNKEDSDSETPNVELAA